MSNRKDKDKDISLDKRAIRIKIRIPKEKGTYKSALIPVSY
jgi:hypothetical protein